MHVFRPPAEPPENHVSATTLLRDSFLMAAKARLRRRRRSSRTSARRARSRRRTASHGARYFVRHWYKATLKLWEDARHAQSEAAHQARLRQAVADGEARVAEAQEAEIALWAAADAQRAARAGTEERAEADGRRGGDGGAGTRAAR